MSKPFSKFTLAYLCAPTNGGIAALLQSTRLVAAGVELGSLIWVLFTHYTRHDESRKPKRREEESALFLAAIAAGVGAALGAGRGSGHRTN
jgi:hypothetical protein